MKLKVIEQTPAEGDRWSDDKTGKMKLEGDRWTEEKTGKRTVPKRNILYVEDEDTNWLLAAPNLREKYNLVRARDAREAFERVGRFQFDCILMDIQLANSELDGIQITRALRGHFHQDQLPSYAVIPKWAPVVPIIFVTAYTARYKREELVEMGGSELIGKPVNFTALALAISRCISARLLVAPAP